jgi:Fe-S cluster assembly protein SufD
MNAEIRQIKTVAEQALADAFSAVKGKLPGDGSVGELRKAAFETFEAKGLPHRRVEEWKYTDLRTLMRDAKPLASPPDAAAKQQAKDAGKILGAVDRRRLVVVDGTFVPELSDLANLETGLFIGSLANALATSDADAMKLLGRVLPMPNDPAVALNTAFMGDGVVIRVADGKTIERPVHIAFFTTGAKATSSFSRSLAMIGEGANITLIESHEGPNGVDYQVNTAIELVAGAKSQVEHIKIMFDGDKALHISTLMAAIAGDAVYNDFSFAVGGSVVRNQLSLKFGAEGTQAKIGGASLLKARQHVDTTMVADHAKGHCTSRELFKSVLDGESRSVFQGKIIVRPDAQKTDGKMMTRALLLSEDAEADAKPELEIFADDVVCGHGATVGAIDEDLLFYLLARGIPRKDAEALLVEAFIGEAMENLAHEGVREALMDHARVWLAARS